MEEEGTREAYGEALLELGRQHPDIVVLDADTSTSTRTSWFAKAFPNRFFNFGVAEANMIGYAAGLALSGKTPFVSSFAIFGSLRPYEQIRTSICWPNMNVKIVVTHAGISVGEDGASHQSIEDIGAMRLFPNMTVIVPADANETKKAVFASYEHKGPVYIRLGRAKFPLLPEAPFEIGKGRIMKEGKDITIIACGLMVSEALKASEMLEKHNIRAKVVNISTIKPIDKELIIACAKETKAIITAEEHSVIGGLGSCVCEVLSEEKPTIIKRIGINDVFGTSGKPSELLSYFKVDAKTIYEEGLKLVHSYGG